MKKHCTILVITLLFALCLSGCQAKQQKSPDQEAAENFLKAYFSMELPQMADQISVESTSIELPEYYTANFTSKGQNQMIENRYTDSIYQIAEQNNTKYKCDTVTFEAVDGSSTNYHFTVSLLDESNNSIQCKGDIYLVQENDSWLIDGFYPVFDSLLK